jgi:hypothetical protein
MTPSELTDKTTPIANSWVSYNDLLAQKNAGNVNHALLLSNIALVGRADLTNYLLVLLLQKDTTLNSTGTLNVTQNATDLTGLQHQLDAIIEIMLADNVLLHKIVGD